MPPSELSPFSLPLWFTLLPSLAHPSTPCACLTVNLPLRQRGGPPFQPNQPSFTVTRILDPEHKEPWVALGPILLASGLTTLEGLLSFGLRTPAYDLALGGVAPFKDIWVPLKLARTCATRLDRLEELDGLLEWRSRSAWTVEDKEEGGLVSNWKIGSDKVDPSQYSTAAMLATTFPRIHLLPSGTQVRTFVPPEFADSPATPAPMPLLATGHDDLHRRVLEWTTREWEDWLEGDEDDEYGRRTASGSDGRERDLLATSFFSAGLSLLALTDSLPPEALDHAPPGSSVLLAPAHRFPDRASSTADSGLGMLSTSRVASPPPLGLVEVPTELELTRHELATGSGKARLALVDFLSRLVAREWIRALEAELNKVAQPHVPSAAIAQQLAGAAGGVPAEQFEALVARVEALERAAAVGAANDAANGVQSPGRGSSLVERESGRVGKLEAENARLRREMRELSERRVAVAGTPEQVRTPEWMVQLPVLVVIGGVLWWWNANFKT